MTLKSWIVFLGFLVQGYSHPYEASLSKIFGEILKFCLEFLNMMILTQREIDAIGC